MLETLPLSLHTIESITELLVNAVTSYGIFGLGVGVFLLGEVVIVTALILSQQGTFALSNVIIAATIGSLLADLFWFTVGRHFPTKLMPSFLQDYFLAPANQALDSIIRNHYFIALLFFSFFIGTRLIVLLYLSRKPLSWPRFILYDAIGTFFYLIVFSLIGIALGQAIHELLPAYKLVSSILVGLLLIIIISVISRRLFAQATTANKDRQRHRRN